MERFPERFDAPESATAKRVPLPCGGLGLDVACDIIPDHHIYPASPRQQGWCFSIAGDDALPVQHFAGDFGGASVIQTCDFNTYKAE